MKYKNQKNRLKVAGLAASGIIGNRADALLCSLLGEDAATVLCLCVALLWAWPRPCELALLWSLRLVSVGSFVCAAAGITSHVFLGSAAAPVWAWVVYLSLFGGMCCLFCRRAG